MATGSEAPTALLVARLARRLPARGRRACATCSRDHPTSRERVVETGERGEGGDRTLVIDAAAEDVVFAELERLHARRRALHRRLRGARRTSTSATPDVLVVIDPIDGSLNAKRGLTHHALSIAVADGPTMADVVFGYVYDLGPGEEWRATRGGGRAASTARRCDAAARAPHARRAPRARRHRVGRPALARRVLATRSCDVTGRAARHRARSRSRCARSPRRASTAWPRCGSCRAVDAAAAQLIVRESGGARRLHRRWTTRSARRSTSSRARPSSPPAPTAALAELGHAARRRG